MNKMNELTGLQTLQAPTKAFPHYHYMCICGKPVNNSQAWFADSKQWHKNCLPNTVSVL